MRPPELRVLGAGDVAVLEAFLCAHADSSMIPRSNARAAGLVDAGAPLQGTYVGGFFAGRLVGVAAHYWNGMLAVQCPGAGPDPLATELLAALATRAVTTTGRAVAGLLGPHVQVVAVRAGLGLGAATAALDSRERLYALALADLVVPAALADGRVAARTPRAEDLPWLTDWRVDYVVEALRAPRSAETVERARADMARLGERGDAWLLVDGAAGATTGTPGAPLAFAAFNARLPDMVQVGGVWTPPALRGRGFARAAVAAALADAARAGASRAVLFTDEHNAPACRAYEALGFGVVGDFGLVLFA